MEESFNLGLLFAYEDEEYLGQHANDKNYTDQKQMMQNKLKAYFKLTKDEIHTLQ